MRIAWVSECRRIVAFAYPPERTTRPLKQESTNCSQLPGLCKSLRNSPTSTNGQSSILRSEHLLLYLIFIIHVVVIPTGVLCEGCKSAPPYLSYTTASLTPTARSKAQILHHAAYCKRPSVLALMQQLMPLMPARPSSLGQRHNCKELRLDQAGTITQFKVQSVCHSATCAQAQHLGAHVAWHFIS